MMKHQKLQQSGTYDASTTNQLTLANGVEIADAIKILSQIAVPLKDNSFNIAFN